MTRRSIGRPRANQLRRYLNQIPEDFEMCFKVWEEITIPSYANQPRYGVESRSAESTVSRCEAVQ